MNPDLSRRVAAAMHALGPEALTEDERFEIGPATEQAEAFADLPGWVQQLVARAEGGAG